MKLTKRTTVLYMDADTTTWDEFMSESNEYGVTSDDFNRKASVKRFVFNPSGVYDYHMLKSMQSANSSMVALLALDELSTRDRFAQIVVFSHDLKLQTAFLRAEARKCNPRIYTFSDYVNVAQVLRTLSKFKVTSQQLYSDAGIKSIVYKLKKSKGVLSEECVSYGDKAVKLDIDGFIEIARDFANAWIDLVDSHGEVYMSKCITSCFSYIDFRDSRKLYDTTIEDIANRVFTEEERAKVSEDPLENNTETLKKLIDNFLVLKGGDLNLTRSAYTYKELKKTITGFKDLFPSLKISHWEEIQPAYFGGIVYRVKPEVEYLDVKNGYTLDVNSEYPAVMAKGLYPYGAPTLHLGDYRDHVSEDEDSKHLFLQVFSATFKKKKDTDTRVYVPCLPRSLSKNGGPVMSSNNVVAHKKDIILTDVDMRLFFDNYDVSDYKPIYYYCFNAMESPFSKFINSHYKAKQEATEEMIKAKEEGRPVGPYESVRLEAKLTLNSAYGKFAERPLKESLALCTDISGGTHSELKGFSRSDGNYLPVAIWVAAYAREILMDGIKRAGGSFLYCDTDSIHAEGDIPEAFKGKIDPYKLGAWKVEHIFTAARFLREKCYAEQIETEDGTKIIAKVAGLSEESKEKNITKLEDLVYSDETGKSYDLNVTTTYVNGGMIRNTNASKELKRTSLTCWNLLKPVDINIIKDYIESARKNKFNKSEVVLSKLQYKAIFYLYAMVSYRATTPEGMQNIGSSVHIEMCEHFVRDIMNELKNYNKY